MADACAERRLPRVGDPDEPSRARRKIAYEPYPDLRLKH